MSGSIKEGNFYDLIIIGGGPAGLTSAIYSARGRINHILLEKMPFPGGQILNTDRIENYPGFPRGLSGAELMELFRVQAESFGANIVSAEVTNLSYDDGRFFVHSSGGEFTSYSVIVASGTSPKKLGLEGEERFIGRGVSFCATCDGALHRNRPVAVVGGGDSAIQEALALTRFASRVYVIHRRDKFRAQKILQERVLANSKIELLLSSILTRYIGSDVLESIEVKNLVDGSLRTIDVSCVFLYIGLEPNTGFVKIPGLDMDEHGFVIADADMRTSIPGLFCAGDVRDKTLRQVITAASDGAIAVSSAEKFLEEKYGTA